MATTITKTITFASSDFTHSKPAFDPETSIKGLKYAWSGVTIGSFGTDYGYLTGLTITFNGTAQFAAVSFQSPPPIMSPFSVGKDGINGLFVPFDGSPLPFYGLVLENGVPNNPYIIVNGDQNNVTDKLEVLLSVGVKHNENPGTVNSITVSFVCEIDNTVPLYSVYTGLHVYSPYDSINSPKLHTYLYSKVNPLSWVVGTRVWVSPWFDIVAPPYYYGYTVNNKVYKIGGPLDRSFGTKKRYDVRMSVWRKWWHKKPKIKTITLGPDSYYNVEDDTIDACVNVLLSKSGIITDIIDNTANPLPQPLKYKYWMGWHLTNKQLSNDSFFAKWVFGQDKFFPITGYMHMLYRLAEGYFLSMFLDTGLSGEFGDLSAMADKYAMLTVAGLSIGFTFVWWLLNIQLSISFMPELFIGANSGWLFASIGATSYTPLGLIGAAILVLMFLWSIFSQKRKEVQESCLRFLGEYLETNNANGPYIELGGILSRVQNMTDPKLGYYCDGVYFYSQPTISGITVKEMSSTNALVSEDPLKQEFHYSVQCDVPTTLVELPKFMLLPYTSGIPIEFDGSVWYSAAIMHTVVLTECAELLVTPPTQVFTLPYGYVISFISQADADTRAQLIATNIDHFVNGVYNYGVPLSEDNLGVLDSYFTHQIRVETNPTICTVYYNNTDHLGALPGRKLYYDVEGRYPVMNGFYAIDGTGGNFRYFYEVQNNLIINRYTMISSSSTTVQGNPGILTVDTTNLQFSSNWYMQSSSAAEISWIVIRIPRCLDTNTIIEYNYVVRGYYDSTGNMFYLYADNYTHYTMSEAPADYYLPLIEWIDEKIFQYSPHISINIDIQEICLPATAYQNALYGFYVAGSSDGNICPLYNAVNLTVRVYVGATLKHTYTVVTNESGKTYVPYGSYVLPSDNVTSIIITSINGANPIGNITYTIGTFTNCTGCSSVDPYASGLEACWNLEDAASPIVDSVGNVNLDVINNVPFHMAGKVGSYCVQFNTSTSRATKINGAAFDLPTFSISTWVKCVGETGGYRYILNHIDKVQAYSPIVKGGWMLFLDDTPGQNLGLTLINSAGAFTPLTSNISVNDGLWHHIVATYNGTTHNVNYYKDGVPDAGNPYFSSITPYYASGMNITMGNADDINSFSFLGFIDATGVWSRELTYCDIVALYNAGNGLACV